MLANGGDLPADGLPILLTDTLESPFAAPPHFAHAPLFERRLAEENERARRVKADTPVIVCLGNPPYFRQVIDADEMGVVERQGGWVRYGDEGSEPIFEDFLRDAPSVHAKNLYNLYVYFWRWALWKVFESGEGRGVVSFITAASYLRGPGFAGMRRHMRERFEELWILDIGGEGRGARRSENVFAIQTPVAIAVGYRGEDTRDDKPAHIRYARIDGSREQKLGTLQAVASVDDIEWRDCFAAWTEPFTPAGEGDFFSWPLLSDCFPWQHSGVQFKRTWPIAPLAATLEARWETLVNATESQRRTLFRETSARTVAGLGEIADVVPLAERYAFRSFDRHYSLADPRVADRPRPDLRKTAGARQLFLTSQFAEPLSDGPAGTISHLTPDLHHFAGRGGKDVIPLWRDSEATEPNLTSGLLSALSTTLGSAISPEDFLSYCYAILQAPSYTSRFHEELETPGPRIPITTNGALFEHAVTAGGSSSGSIPMVSASSHRASEPGACHRAQRDT